MTHSLDLRARPDWAPIKSETKIGTHLVRSWMEPRLPGDPYRDLIATANHGDTLRVIAIDPVVVDDLGPSQEVDRRTAQLVGGLSELLRLPGDVDELLNYATREYAAPNWSGPTACIGIVELQGGNVRAWRHGDIDIWCETPSGAGSLFPGDMLVRSARDAWESRDKSEPTMGVQRRLLSDPKVWVSAPIGMPDAAREFACEANVVKVVLATDGVALDRARVEDPFGFLEGAAQVAPAGWPHPSPHGDIALAMIVPG